MPTHEQELIVVTRTVIRLQTQQRKLKRQLKQVQAQLRAERKHQRALLQSLAAMREPDAFPSRLTNGATAIRRTRLDAVAVAGGKITIANPEDK